MQLARRDERMEELHRATPAQTEGPELATKSYQIGNSQWRDEPYDVTSIERDLSNPGEGDGRSCVTGPSLIVERDVQVPHPNVDQDEGKHRVTMMLDDARLDATGRSRGTSWSTRLRSTSGRSASTSQG